VSLPSHRAGEGRQGPARSAADRRVQHRHAVASKAEVDALLSRAQAAEPRLPTDARPSMGIYSGYFRDPDGHLWEILYTHGSSARRSNRIVKNQRQLRR